MLRLFQLENSETEGPSTALLVLPFDKSVVLKGRLKVEVVTSNGFLEILGYQLTKSQGPVEVVSPKCHSLLELKAWKNPISVEEEDQGEKNAKKELKKKISKENQSEVLRNFVPEAELAVLLRGCSSEFIENFDSHVKCLDVRLGLAFEDNYGNCPSVGKSVEKLLNANLIPAENCGTNIKIFQAGEDWKLVEQSIEFSIANNVQPRIAAVGGKGVGKSWFLKHLANRLQSPPFRWKKILFVDLDPGQAEFTLPGCLSLSVIEGPLLGPNFSHSSNEFTKIQPLRTFYLGDVNVSNVVQRYRRCVNDLLAFAESNPDLAAIPWLVNTMGFTKSVGISLLKSNLEAAQPSTVVSIVSASKSKNYPFSLRDFKFERRRGKGNSTMDGQPREIEWTVHEVELSMA